MKHQSTDQLQLLIDSLGDASLCAGGRIEVLQRIRQTAAKLYQNVPESSATHGDQIDTLVLKAVDAALHPFNPETFGLSINQSHPAAEYSQP